MNKIERLRAAIENPQALQREREETWEKIQRVDPVLAKLLQELKAKMGKGSLLNLRFKQCQSQH